MPFSKAPADKDIIVLDVETKKSFEEVGGFENREQLGVSYLGVYSYAQDKFFGFFEDDLKTFEDIVRVTNPTIVGFNTIHFDNPVIQPYMKDVKLADCEQVDILRLLEDELGHRVKLDTVAQATLFANKSGDGLDAIRWYREGDFESLAKYCIDDVRITRDVYEFGLRHGVVYYTSGGDKLPVKASWATGTTIREKLEEAFKKHEQIHIEYFEVAEDKDTEIIQRTIEIIEMGSGNEFKAFCHSANDTLIFNVANVWDIEETGNKFAHQDTMF